MRMRICGIHDGRVLISYFKQPIRLLRIILVVAAYYVVTGTDVIQSKPVSLCGGGMCRRRRAMEIVSIIFALY